MRVFAVMTAGMAFVGAALAMMLTAHERSPSRAWCGRWQFCW
jgi:hypothetical protein